MRIDQALTLTCPLAFQVAIAENIGPWFKDYLHVTARKGKLRLGVLPVGRFLRVLRSSLSGLRGKGDSGVAVGTWRLPCGLTAAQAWAIIHRESSKVSVPYLVEGLIGSGAGPRVTPLPQPIKVHQVARRKPQAVLGPVKADPLAGLTFEKLSQRLDKALARNAFRVHVLVTDLTRLLEKLPECEVEPRRLVQAMCAVEKVLMLSRRAVVWLEMKTPAEMKAETGKAAYAAQRRAVKLARIAERRERLRQRKLAGVQVTKGKVVRLKVRRPVEEPAVPALQVVQPVAEIIPLEAACEKLWFKLGQRSKACFNVGTGKSETRATCTGATSKANRRRKAAYFQKLKAAGQLAA